MFSLICSLSSKVMVWWEVFVSARTFMHKLHYMCFTGISVVHCCILHFHSTSSDIQSEKKKILSLCLNNYSKYLFEMETVCLDFFLMAAKSWSLVSVCALSKPRGIASRQSGQRDEQNLVRDDFLASRGLDK